RRASARPPPTGALGHEGVEDRLLLRIVGRRVLRVPLHAHDPTVGPLHALHRAVVGHGRDGEAGAEAVDALVVDTVAGRALEAQTGEAAAGLHDDGVVHQAMALDVLVQR